MKYLQLLYFCFFNFVVFSQDPNFSQFYNIPVYYNPAMNAMDNGFTITSQNRALWGLIPKQLNTFVLAAEVESIGPFNLGCLAVSDYEGQSNLNTNSGYFNFSFTPTVFNPSKHKIQFGSSIGVINRTINSKNFVFSDQLDEVYGNINPTKFKNNTNAFSTLDLGFGLAYRYYHKSKSSIRKYNHLVTSGVSINHFPNGRQAFVDQSLNIQPKLIFHCDYKFLSNIKVYSASFIFENQNPFQTFTFGLSSRLPISQEANSHKLTFGLYYRNRFTHSKIKHSDALIFTLGTDIFYGINKKRFKIYYSYDLTISQLGNNYSGGSHELSLQLKFDDLIFLKAKASKNFKQRMHKCPSDL